MKKRKCVSMLLALYSCILLAKCTGEPAVRGTESTSPPTESKALLDDMDDDQVMDDNYAGSVVEDQEYSRVGFVLGDANGDGTIDIVDSSVVAQSVDGQNPIPFDKQAADADCDGTVTKGDAKLIEEFVNGIIPSLVCPGYHGHNTFDPLYLDPDQYETYTSDHYTLYSINPLDGFNVAKALANMEACYALQIRATPILATYTEFQAPLGIRSKTIAFLPGRSCGIGCGNKHRVEMRPDAIPNPNVIGDRETMWIPYYEQQRGHIDTWHKLLAFDPANTDWNSAFAHSMAITCSEAIGTGDHHSNVDFVNRALREWVALNPKQSWVDLLASGTGNFVWNSGRSQGINDLFGAMLAELYRRHGVDYFHDLTNELQNSAKYDAITTAHDQACNWLLASHAVTDGATTKLMIDEWRLPDDCFRSLTAKIAINSSWNGGYCADVTISNPSGMTTTSWTVDIDLNGASVNNVWNVDASYQGDIMTAVSPQNSGAIQPGGNTTFGFCANTSTGAIPTIVSAQ